MTGHTYHSDAISVKSSRHIFYLPLRLNQSAGADLAFTIEQEVRACKADGWEDVPKPYADHNLDDQLTGSKGRFDRFSYGEFVYFHPFIQRALFGREKAVTILKRTDVSDIAFRIRHEGRNLTFTVAVRRLWLCLFDFGVAVAMLEVDGAAKTLAELLVFQNAARRDYPPYFGFKDVPTEAELLFKEYPESITVKFRPKGSAPPDKTFTPGAEVFRDCVLKHGVTPLAPHWAELLSPLSIEGAMDGQGKPLAGVHARWRQTIDERLPTVTFLHAPDAGAISDGDWVRLGSMDDPGKAPLPYGEKFLAENFNNAAFYDRHWHGTHGTRYVIYGYSFVVCTDSEWYGEKILMHHVSRMYATMGLLIHAQHAMLLSISAQASEIAPEDTGRLKALQQRFNRFVQQFRFTNVSNQQQARELYAKWTATLELDALYAEVTEQIRDAAMIIDTDEQNRQSQAALRLNMMAAVALPATVACGILGMNAVFNDKAMPGLGGDDIALQGALAAAVFALVYLIAAGMMLIHRLFADRERRFPTGMIVALASIGLAAFVVAERYDSGACPNRNAFACLLKKPGGGETPAALGKLS